MDENYNMYILGKTHASCKVAMPDWFSSDKEKYYYMMGRMDFFYGNDNPDTKNRMEEIEKSWENNLNS